MVNDPVAVPAQAGFVVVTEDTGGAGETVNVAVHVCVALQSLVTVNVTVLLPPHAEGAPVLLLLNTGLHPPDMDVEASQSAYFASITDCV